MTLNSEKSMMATTVLWHQQPTFQLIPLTHECPFLEVVYDVQSQALVIITKLQKEKFHMVTQVDSDGFPIKMKNGKMHQDQTEYKKERRPLSTSHDYYIKGKEEIEEFVDLFLFNSEFNYKKFMVEPVVEPVKAEEVLSPKLEKVE